MNALNIQTGWWVVANDRFVAVYNTTRSTPGGIYEGHTDMVCV